MGIDPETGYYSLREILGYNAKWNIVLSDRGRGKSYGTKLFLMAQEGRFMALYRQQPDLEHALEDWLDPLVENGWSFDDFAWDGDVKGGYMNLLYRGEIKGYFRILTKVNAIKQEKFPDDLDWMWLDEFIPMAYKKLPGISSEGDAIRTIYKTIDHDSAHPKETRGFKPLRVLLFANPFTWDNPILSYFHVDGLLGPGIHRAGPGIVWEMLPPHEERNEARRREEEHLGSEVNRTMGFMQQAAFVGPIPKGSVPVVSLRIRASFYLLYQSPDGLKLHVRRTKEHRNAVSYYSGRKVRVGTLEGLQEDEICLEDSRYLELWRRMIYRGMIGFEDINVKFDFIRDLDSIRL